MSRKNIDIKLFDLNEATNEIKNEKKHINAPIITNVSPDFLKMQQGTATNIAARITPFGTNTQHIKDPDTGNDLLIKEGLILDVENFIETSKKLTDTTFKFLDFIYVKFTSNPNEVVTFSLKEYMDICNLKDRKNAINQIEKSIDALMKVRLNFKDKTRGKNREQEFDKMALCQRGAYKNGMVIFRLGADAAEYLTRCSVMWVPRSIFTFNSKYQPNARVFLRKISEHKRMNIKKANSDTIAVLTLLKTTDNIPSYEEVMASDKHVTQRIIEPFEAGLNDIPDLKWNYLNKNGTKLSDEELGNMDYKIFVKCHIKITWNDYPYEE